MRKHILALLFLLLPLMAVAQTRYWNQGPLTWNDFRTVISPDGSNSLLYYYFGYTNDNNEVRTPEGIKVDCYRAEAYMVPASSWVDANHRTELNLRYNQLVFDIVEAERRELSRTLLSAGTQKSADLALSNAKTHLCTILITLSTASAGGTDSTAIAAWEQTIRQRLDTLEVDPQPRFSRGDVFTDAYLLFTSHDPSGETAHFFDSGFGLALGYDLGYKRFSFINNLYINGSETLGYLTGYTSDGSTFVVEPGQSTEFVNYMVALGYRIVDEERYSLTPQLGLSLGTVSFKYNGMPVSGKCNGVTFGFNYRFHFLERFHCAGNGCVLIGTSELMTASLDFSFLMRYNNFTRTDGSLDGWSALFSMGIGLGAYTVK